MKYATLTWLVSLLTLLAAGCGFGSNADGAAPDVDSRADQDGETTADSDVESGRDEPDQPTNNNSATGDDDSHPRTSNAGDLSNPMSVDWVWRQSVAIGQKPFDGGQSLRIAPTPRNVWVGGDSINQEGTPSLVRLDEDGVEEWSSPFAPTSLDFFGADSLGALDADDQFGAAVVLHVTDADSHGTAVVIMLDPSGDVLWEAPFDHSEQSPFVVGSSVEIDRTLGAVFATAWLNRSVVHTMGVDREGKLIWLNGDSQLGSAGFHMVALVGPIPVSSGLLVTCSQVIGDQAINAVDSGTGNVLGAVDLSPNDDSLCLGVWPTCGEPAPIAPSDLPIIRCEHKSPDTYGLCLDLVSLAPPVEESIMEPLTRVRCFDEWQGVNIEHVLRSGIEDTVLIGSATTGTGQAARVEKQVLPENHTLWIATLDGAGEITRFQSFGGDGAISVADAAVDEEGSIFVAGSFDGEVDLGTGPLTPASGTDIFVMKLRP